VLVVVVQDPSSLIVRAVSHMILTSFKNDGEAHLDGLKQTVRWKYRRARESPSWATRDHSTSNTELSPISAVIASPDESKTDGIRGGRCVSRCGAATSECCCLIRLGVEVE